MNDENKTPSHTTKAGATVFGNLLFGSECPDHSLCYSPSPFANRRNEENVAREPPVDGKVLAFDNPAASAKTTMISNNAGPNRPATAKYRPMTAAGCSKNSRVDSRPVSAAGHPSNLPRPATAAGGEISVNPVINGVRRSKEENLKQTMKSVADLRQQRRREKEEVAAFNVKAEQTRREVIELRRKLSERFRQAKVDREQRSREENLAKIEKEIQFKSRVYVEHKQTLKEMEDARRRMSVAARMKLRQNHREGNERMKLLSIQEDQALFEERHESSLAVQNTKLDDAFNRRKSFAFRNGDARRIRQLFAQREAERVNDEHESYELKWAGERDTDEYRELIAQERRNSLAFRNAEAKRVRDLDAQKKSYELHDDHESYELKWAGERDAEEYRELIAQERRESLAFRNAEAKRIRDLEAQMKSDELHNEHESYELKWSGERDADSYKRQMEEKRRDSLAFRNAEAKRVRNLEAQMKSYELHDDHESYELKWAGERDAEEYRELIAQERRESLAFRNAEAKRIRDLEAQMKSDELHNEHESYELKWSGERDAEEYRQLLSQERRNSLAFRNQEAARHDAVMRELISLANEREHESYMLKWAGENDAKQYVMEQADLRRQSLAFRNAEGRRHRDIDHDIRVKESNEIARDEELKAACKCCAV